ncbi:MAG: hypothetical protein KF868_13770 [Acidobacteria bacterium]|nr:hypothetical protein [Acidobacteriota bacterium]
MIGNAQRSLYPLVRLVLPKTVSSYTDERTTVPAIFIDLFNKVQTDRILANREFVGKEWLSCLRKNRVDFPLRVRGNFPVATVVVS